MDSRKEQLIGEITERLKRLCPKMTEDEFARMVDDMANMTLKHERYSTPTRDELQRSTDAERDWQTRGDGSAGARGT